MGPCSIVKGVYITRGPNGLIKSSNSVIDIIMYRKMCETIATLIVTKTV